MTDPRDDVFGMVDGYLHGLLNVEQKNYVDKQVETNEVWQAAMAQTKARLTLVQQVPVTEASEQLIQDTLEKIDKKEQSASRNRRRLIFSIPSALAAVIAILASLNIYYATMTASPFDLQVTGTCLGAGRESSCLEL